MVGHKLELGLGTAIVVTLLLACGSGTPSSPGGLGPKMGIGRPCDLGVAAGAADGVYSTSARECLTGVCLKPVLQQGAAPHSPETAAYCSAECSEDSDCAGELRDPGNPADQRCESGFTCGIPFVLGPICCKKMCLCKDFLSPAGALTPTACTGEGGATCGGTAPGAPASMGEGPVMQTDIYISVAPQRLLDLVFMVDNSPSMAPKVAKMNAQFPKLIQALKDPNEGVLPDLRVAIIDSDLGTGCAYSAGSCGPKNASGAATACYGDLGKFQMLTSPTPCTFDAGAQFLEVKNGQPANFPASADINQVFACLTGNLGTLGCGLEHQLQAFEFALAAKGVGTEEQQAAFLRPNAYLGLVFVTDEDDCSAATNEGMFGDRPELHGESSSLRCATRAHQCGGMNLSTSGPGYPTTQSYTHAFSGCMARTDPCPNPTDGNTSDPYDTSGPTTCSPLKDVRRLAAEIKGLKSDPDSQILVAGIFGWPRSDSDMASATYKIAPVPNPNTADTAHPTVFEYWPVCYDPAHPPTVATTDPATGFDATAAGWGATGGLRNSAFVDEFGENGFKFSICDLDFTGAMAGIGKAVAKRLQNLCADYKLLDADDSTPGVQPNCRVVWRTPVTDPENPTKIIYQESPTSLPFCPPGATRGTVAEDCWQVLIDHDKCPKTGQLISVLRTAAEIASQPSLSPGTKLGMQCLACPNLDPGMPVPAGCDYSL